MTRKVLGRGLDALIPSAAPVPTPHPAQRPTGQQILSVPVQQIRSNPRQPRTQFDDDRLAELAASIREKGVLEPLILRVVGGGEYELVAGERRLRSAELAGLEMVPAVVREFTDREALEVALIENLQREDINPVDEARAYQRLAEEFGRTHAEISEQVGKDRTTITNLLRLLRLPQQLLDYVARGTLSVGHARVLVSLEDPQDAIALADRILREDWSVRRAELVVSKRRSSRDRKSAGKPQSELSRRRREVQRVEEALRYALGTEVHLKHGPKSGKIEIHYSSNEELERLIVLLNVQVH